MIPRPCLTIAPISNVAPDWLLLDWKEMKRAESAGGATSAQGVETHRAHVHAYLG